MSDSKIHGPMDGSRAACGRSKGATIDHRWSTVTCDDCKAARRADEEQLALAGAVS